MPALTNPRGKPRRKASARCQRREDIDEDRDDACDREERRVGAPADGVADHSARDAAAEEGGDDDAEIGARSEHGQVTHLAEKGGKECRQGGVPAMRADAEQASDEGRTQDVAAKDPRQGCQERLRRFPFPWPQRLGNAAPDEEHQERGKHTHAKQQPPSELCRRIGEDQRRQQHGAPHPTAQALCTAPSARPRASGRMISAMSTAPQASGDRATARRHHPRAGSAKTLRNRDARAYLA